MALVLVNVHCGPFRSYDRALIGSGWVQFTPTAPGWVPSGDSDYVPQPVKRRLESGEASVTLVAPTDEASGPITYQVTVHIDPDLDKTYPIEMPTDPADGATYELTDRNEITGLLGSGTGGGGGGGFGGDGHGGFGA